MQGTYRGRFAPSPTGALHAGSLVAALASWLDARAQGGRWLVRIEDVDLPRCVSGADEAILRQLQACGLVPDEPPQWQSRRGALYAHALEQLLASGDAFACACSRGEVLAANAALGRMRTRHGELVYTGTCRPERGGLQGRSPRAWRLRVPDAPADRIEWVDRRLARQSQSLSEEVGDFVLRRADGLWAYQLAVVVDDAAQGITDVVRGEDLADNTPRQIHLQRCLGVATPRYLHAPLVLDSHGEKLSKQTGALALAIDTETQALDALRSAGMVLGLHLQALSRADWLGEAIAAWRERWPNPRGLDASR
jgi:glutamyl-Q tRNA(Asp) synthetase